MAFLGTVCRTTVMVSGATVVAGTELTEHTSMVLKLLSADAPFWKWRRSQ